MVSCMDQNTSKQEKLYSGNLSKYVEKSWNNKDFSLFDNIIDISYLRVLNNVNIATNPRELKANISVFHRGFPDLSIEINTAAFKSNKAYLAWTFKGTNTGIFGENPATGKKVEVHGYSVIAFNKEGKITREDVYFNELDFLQQLGYTLLLPNFE